MSTISYIVPHRYSSESDQNRLNGSFIPKYDNLGILQFYLEDTNKVHNQIFKLTLTLPDGNTIVRETELSMSNVLIFGVPEVNFSKEKQFEFSLDLPHSSKIIQFPSTTLVLKSRYPLSQIIRNPINLVEFIQAKYSIAQFENVLWKKILLSFFPFLSLIGYEIINIAEGSGLYESLLSGQRRRLIVAIPLALIILESLFCRNQSSVFHLVLLFTSFVLFYNANQVHTAKYFFGFSCLFFALALTSELSGAETLAAQFAYWTFMFILAGIITEQLTKIKLLKG